MGRSLIWRYLQNCSRRSETVRIRWVLVRLSTELEFQGLKQNLLIFRLKHSDCLYLRYRRRKSMANCCSILHQSRRSLERSRCRYWIHCLSIDAIKFVVFAWFHNNRFGLCRSNRWYHCSYEKNRYNGQNSWIYRYSWSCYVIESNSKDQNFELARLCHENTVSWVNTNRIWRDFLCDWLKLFVFRYNFEQRYFWKPNIWNHYRSIVSKRRKTEHFVWKGNRQHSKNRKKGNRKCSEPIEIEKHSFFQNRRNCDRRRSLFMPDRLWNLSVSVYMWDLQLRIHLRCRHWPLHTM